MNTNKGGGRHYFSLSFFSFGFRCYDWVLRSRSPNRRQAETLPHKTPTHTSHTQQLLSDIIFPCSSGINTNIAMFGGKLSLASRCVAVCWECRLTIVTYRNVTAGAFRSVVLKDEKGSAVSEGVDTLRFLMQLDTL